MPSPQSSPNLSTTSPTRKALHERSQSSTNQDSLRLVRDDRNSDGDIFSKSPFPTKPAHILRPVPSYGPGSPFAEGNSVSGDELPERLLQHVNRNKGKNRAQSNASRRPSQDARTLSLKRSVKALRDHYESQSTSSQSSTPYGPLSPELDAQNLRDVPNLLELSRTNSDDLATYAIDHRPSIRLNSYKSDESLPTIPSSPRTSQEHSAAQDFPKTPERTSLPAFSSPNYEILGVSPHPDPFDTSNIDPFDHSSDPELPEESSSPNVIRLDRSSPPVLDPSSSAQASESSSPNVIRLGAPSSPVESPFGRSSSSEQSDDPSSSPNVVRIQGSSSPLPRLLDVSSFNTPNVVQLSSSSSPNVVQIGSSSSPLNIKSHRSSESLTSMGTVRKNAQGAREQPSYATFPESDTQYSSSPPARRLGRYPSTSSLALSDVAAEPVAQTVTVESQEEEPQTFLESSPAPSIQYPVVHAPPASAYEHIVVPKRLARSSAVMPRSSGEWTPNLSVIPSEWSGERQHSQHEASMGDVSPIQDEWLDEQHHDQPEASTSIVSPIDEEHLDEHLDELPLPLPPKLAHSRNATNSTIRQVIENDYESTESKDNLTELRTASLQGKASGFITLISSHSSGSRQNSMQSSLRRPSSNGSLRSSLPGWARRFYSAGGSQLAVNVFGINSPNRNSWYSSQYPISSDMTSPRPGTASTSPRESNLPLGIFRPRTRRERRDTELSAPLSPTSHAVTESSSEEEQPPVRRARDRRPISIPLDPADPRSHWAGAEQAALEQELRDMESRMRQSRIAQEWSPHLHQDVRVAKAGKGHGRWWRAPSLEDGGVGEPIYGPRNRQVLAFAFGFILPIMWFIAAILPLPPKPSEYPVDIEEKAGSPDSRKTQQPRPSTNVPRPSTNVRMSRQDLESHIRMEQKIAHYEEIRYDNARWWRNLNRFMCLVGAAVIALVISLAILGTRNGGFS